MKQITLANPINIYIKKRKYITRFILCCFCGAYAAEYTGRPKRAAGGGLPQNRLDAGGRVLGVYGILRGGMKGFWCMSLTVCDGCPRFDRSVVPDILAAVGCRPCNAFGLSLWHYFAFALTSLRSSVGTELFVSPRVSGFGFDDSCCYENALAEV